MTEERKNDEIDLIEIFLNIYIFLKKHFWFLIIATFIGAGFGYSIKYITKKHYESTMIIDSYVLTEDIVIDYIDNINKIIADNGYSFLSKKMKIDSSLIATITEINAESAYNEKDKENKGYLYVHVNVTDNKVLAELKNALSNFLDQEPFVKNEIEIFIQNNNNIIAKIDDEISKLELLQSNAIKSNQDKGKVNIYNDQKSFQNEILSLLKEKQSREKLLKFATPFRVIQDFTIFKKAVRKTVTYTLTGGVIFGLLAMIYLIIRMVNRNIKEKELS